MKSNKILNILIAAIAIIGGILFIRIFMEDAEAIETNVELQNSVVSPLISFSTWLFKIASNNCIDFIRKKKNHTLSIDSDFSNEDGDRMRVDLKSPNRNPEEEAIRAQKVKLMREIVTTLKPRYKELIELRYFKELSYEEIATELDLPLGTVKAQLFRAREFLFNIMKNSKGSI